MPTNSNEEPREYTSKEVTEQFMQHIATMIDYWDRTPGHSSREKLEGLAHSILCALDGCSAHLPGFLVVPYPHPDDKEYHIENEENWFPENHEAEVNGALEPYLHEVLFKYAKR